MAFRRIGVILPILAFLSVACNGGSEAASTTPAPQPPAPTVEEPFTTNDTDPVETSSTTLPVFADGPLADVCGDTIVVQASNFPDVGSGPLYALLGETPIIDADRQAVAAPLVRPDGTVEDVALEIRSGGPAVGFRSPIVVMAQDDTIHLAVASTAVSVRDRSSLETSAVMSLTDRSRDAVIIDPASYPEIVDLRALGAENVEVRHVTDAPVISFLSSTGVLNPGQLVPGSDGLPASFVGAGGAIAQQGDLTLEPVLYPVLPQWGRPVMALPAASAGWSSLDDLVVVDTGRQRLSDECLGRFVRVLQQSIVAYVADPVPTNVVMSGVRSQFNPLARFTPELLDAATRIAVEDGVFDSTRSDAPGSILTDGLDDFLIDLASAMDVAPPTIDELIDQRFIDRTISR